MDQRNQWTDIGFSATKGGTQNRTALAGPLMADCVEKSFLADA
jgi:limonene-1,2-epoxide hydrolase